MLKDLNDGYDMLKETPYGNNLTTDFAFTAIENEELGLDDFAEFLEDEATMAKIEALTTVRDSHDGTPNWHERV